MWLAPTDFLNGCAFHVSAVLLSRAVKFGCIMAVPLMQSLAGHAHLIVYAYTIPESIIVRIYALASVAVTQ